MKLTSEKGDPDFISKLNSSISKAGLKIEEQYKSLSKRENEINIQKAKIEQLSTLSQEKESQIKVYEKELRSKQQFIDHDYQNSQSIYYSSNKDLTEEESLQKQKVQSLESKSKKIYNQKSELQHMSENLLHHLIDLTENEKSVKEEKEKISDFVDYIKDSEAMNVNDQIGIQVKSKQTELAQLNQEISQNELNIITQQMNLAQIKTQIAEFQKEEVSMRLKYLFQEQRDVMFIQNISAKIKSSSLSEIRYKKLKNYHKRKKEKLKLRIPRNKKQLIMLENKINQHQKEIEKNKTDLLNNKDETKFCRQQEIKKKADIEILSRRLKRRSQAFPDELSKISQEKNKVVSKLEIERSTLKEKNDLIIRLEEKLKLNQKKLVISNECNKAIKKAEQNFEIKLEQYNFSKEFNATAFREDLNRLNALNEQIVEQEQIYHKLSSQFYKVYQIENEPIPNQKKSKTKSMLVKEKKSIQFVKSKIQQTQLDITNHKQLMSIAQTNMQHNVQINQYLFIHKTIASKENESDVIERSKKIRKNINELENLIEKVKISNENRRNRLSQLNINYYHVADCYHLKQDTENLIIYPKMPGYSFVDARWKQIEQILYSLQTEIAFWKQDCPIPEEHLLRSWAHKLEY